MGAYIGQSPTLIRDHPRNVSLANRLQLPEVASVSCLRVFLS
jgi:hypothetical protein